MAMFTKKNKKNKSEGYSDAWLMGEEGKDDNVSLDSLDFLLAAAPPPDDDSDDADEADEAPSTPRPPSPPAASTPTDRGDSAPVVPTVNVPANSLEGWHLPDFETAGAALAELENAETDFTIIPGSIQNYDLPTPEGRRSDDDDSAEMPSSPPAPVGAPTPDTITALEARADFPAVDLPPPSPNTAFTSIDSDSDSDSDVFDSAAFDSGTTEPAAFTPETTEPAAVVPDAFEPGNGPIRPMSDGPVGPQAATLLEILGLPANSSWEEIRVAHEALVTEHDASVDDDPSRVALARAIRREMNRAYAALRLLAVA